MAFSINGVTIKKPTTFKVERFKVTNLERLADATMAGDLIAKKHKLYYTYDALSGEDLDNILQAIWDTDAVFFPVTYDYNGTSRTMTAYVGSIPSELHRAGRTSNWVWKNVTFDLIEQ